MSKRFRDPAVALLLAAIACYATYNGSELLGIVAIVGFLSICYKPAARRGMDNALSFFERVDKAKFRDLEVEVRQTLQRMEGLQTVQKSNFITNAVLSGLGARQIALLLAIYRSGTFEISGALRETVHELRHRGLVHHDKPRLGESTKVWLSPLGIECALFLTSDRNDSDQALDVSAMTTAVAAPPTYKDPLADEHAG